MCRALIAPMTKSLRPLCLPVLSGCNALLPTYQEPGDGPRAKLRVIYGGGGAKIHPGRDCKPRKYNSARDVMGFRVPGLAKGRRLDMPAAPAGDVFYDEIHARAGEPLTMFFAYRHEHVVSQNLSPDGKRLETDRRIESCDTAPFAFVPEPNAYYEVAFARVGTGCASTLARLVEAQPGSYRHEPMAPLPAPVCR